MVTFSKEDYLKTIYSLSASSGCNVAMSEVANKLEVSKSATTDMVKRLSEMGLVDYEKYHSITLTSKGNQIALQIIRRHRIWELFLMKVLGLSWSEVHDEAELLEHSTSMFLLDKMDEYLLYPNFDPHGDPIPDKFGILPKMDGVISLNNAVCGEYYNVVRVLDSNNQLIKYLTKIKISLNSSIKIIEKLSFDNSIVILIAGQEVSLSEKITSNIFVKFRLEN